MPIKPENRARYPKDWKRIADTIRERAGQRCEGSPAYPDCRAPNGEPLEFDDCEDYEQGQACEHCGGDGRDPGNDYLLVCPACMGEGVRW